MDLATTARQRVLAGANRLCETRFIRKTFLILIGFINAKRTPIVMHGGRTNTIRRITLKIKTPRLLKMTSNVRLPCQFLP